jgi:hypothetical protein
MKKSVRCAYLKSCYIAEELECYGFKTNCPLYMRSNDEPCNDSSFNAAMDDLILRTKRKHDRLNRTATGEKRSTGKPQTTPSTS